MKVKIHPASWTQPRTVQIPPSKSLAHRWIVCASLADGVSRLDNIAYSEDILATMEGMRRLGAQIEAGEHSVTIRGISGPPCVEGEEPVDCNESGSTLRFLIPLCSLSGRPVAFTGRNRLLKRPQGVYEALYRERGLSFVQDGEKIAVQGALAPGRYELDGNVSSQFISGLLFALPLLPEDSVIAIRPPVESRSYLELTMQAMEQFGVTARFTDAHTLHIPGGQTYRPHSGAVEGDFSQLAFFAVLGAAAGDIRCIGVRPDSRQGDKVILDILRQAGASVQECPGGYLVQKGALTGMQIDLADCPDLGPILMVLAGCAQGETHISHVARLRYKESDRIAAMQQELEAFGVSMRAEEDDIFLPGGGLRPCKRELWAHTDHRIAMSMAVAAVCSGAPAVLAGAECVRKSYPGFFEDLQAVGIPVEVLEP